MKRFKYLPRPPLQTVEWTCSHCSIRVRQTTYYADAISTVAVHWCWVPNTSKKLGAPKSIRGFVEMERTK